MSDIKEAKKLLRNKRRPKSPIKAKDYLSSGSTLLNLAVSGFPNGCFAKGKYSLFVGDSDSGKTWLCLSCLAEATINEQFDTYRIIYDNIEDGANMDFEHYFGRKLADRVEPPRGSREKPRYSETLEECYDAIDDLIKAGRPFICIVDSENALTTDAERKKTEEQMKDRRKNKEITGSMTDAKAKIHSTRLRQIKSGLKRNGSILIIISQTRDNMGFGAQFEPKTRAGGRALKFYAVLEIWSAVKKNLTKSVKGKQRQIGILSQVKVKKNHLTGKKRDIDVPIYFSSGIDDVGSCVDFLVEEKHWKSDDKTIDAQEFDFKGKREALIKHIQDNELEFDLKDMVGEVWNEIEDECVVERKNKYA